MPAPSKLAIATSSVQRLVKEEGSYRKEQIQQEERIEKLQGDSSDENAEYLLKQEVLIRPQYYTYLASILITS
jgi:tubulin-specific chaperone A